MWLARVALVSLIACSSRQPGTSAPSCAAVADHMLVLLGKDERAHEIHDVFALRCTRDGWTSAPRECVLDTKSLKDPRGCKAKLTTEQRGALEAELAVVEDHARERPPAACLDYEHVIAKVTACTALPQATRESMRREFEASKATWRSTANRDALAKSCTVSAERTQRAVGTRCGMP